METARHATAILVKLLFSHRGGRYERGISPSYAAQSFASSTTHSPDENDLFSYAYFGA